MELLQNYPVSFLVTIVLPIVSGIFLAFGGYDNLRARADADKQLGRIESNTQKTLEHMPDVSATIKTLDRYEQALSAAGHRDEVLAAVLTQYKGLVRATETWEQFRASTDHEQRAKLSSEILDILSTNLIPVSAPANTPSNPLILGLGANTFRVLFSVPMRIPPELQFLNLPAGTQAHLTEKSSIGFTVIFSPANVPVENFSFTASAEL